MEKSKGRNWVVLTVNLWWCHTTQFSHGYAKIWFSVIPPNPCGWHFPAPSHLYRLSSLKFLVNPQTTGVDCLLSFSQLAMKHREEREWGCEGWGRMSLWTSVTPMRSCHHLSPLGVLYACDVLYLVPFSNARELGFPIRSTGRNMSEMEGEVILYMKCH